MTHQVIVADFPPLYDEIANAFCLHGRTDLVFSWGDCAYNPHGLEIPAEIRVHEAIHGQRQGSGQQVLDWWRRYIEDPNFRLREEVYAHRAEYRWLVGNGNRRQRRRALKSVAAKLASPLYGPVCTAASARSFLEANHERNDH